MATGNSGRFPDIVSTDTKRTTRNLLTAASVTLFASFFELSLHELSLIAGVLGKSNTGGDEVVKWGLVVLLTFLVTVHILNWYGDWIRFSEWWEEKA